MASIKITNLQPAGADFFNDSEDYLSELTSDELILAKGGATPTFAVAVVTAVAWAGGYAYGRWG